MSLSTSPVAPAPEDVERSCERDAKNYELIDGELKQKRVGFLSLAIATRIAEQLNVHFYPRVGVAVVEAMIYCFDKPNHGRKPDVCYVTVDRFVDRRLPPGDIHVPPNLVAEVLSPGNGGIEPEEKLDEYLEAKIPLVWIINPSARTLRVYRQDGTTRLFHADDTLADEPLLPGFVMRVADVFPPA